MIFRRREWFDPAQENGFGPGNFSHLLTLAMSADKRIIYIKGGKEGGVRILAALDPEGNVACNSYLHATVMYFLSADKEDRLKRLVKYWYDRRGGEECDRSTLLVAEKGEFPVGFDEGRRHRDGWYTRTEVSLPLPSPEWAPDSKAFDIREGIYLYFLDGSIRLVPRKEYYSFARWMEGQEVVARQGDVFVLGWRSRRNFPDRAAAGEGREYQPDWAEVTPQSGLPRDAFQFPAHRVELEASNKLVLVHSEHEPVELGAWKEGQVPSQILVMMPGTSRPFQDSRQGD